MTKLPVTVRASSSVGSTGNIQVSGVYHGSVINTNDPLGSNRVLLLVPQVLGTAISNWALPVGDSALFSAVSIGQQVHVWFLGGNRNLPIYAPLNWSSSITGTTDWINVKSAPYNAKGNGIADDTTAIQNALAAAVSGQTVYMPNGTYLISGPLSVAAGVELAGSLGPKHNIYGTTIRLGASFSGSGAITFPSGSSEQRITRLEIDGSAPPAGTCYGIDGNTNAVPYVQLNDLHINGAGLSNGVITTASSNGWRSRNVVVGSTNATGFNINSPDNHWLVCQAIACGTHGWNVQGGQNSKFIDCRADFNGDYGFDIQGAWTTGTGSGGAQFVGLSTDRNVQYGVLITATGNSPMIFSNLATRRDGSNGSGAGVRVSNATVPILISGYQCYPGVNDDGTGTAGPATGISLNGTNTYVSVSDALVHCVTTPISGTLTANRSVATRTSYTSPSAISLVADSA